MRNPTKCYSDICKLQTFEERFQYLQLNGSVGETTFGSNRYWNQRFYQTSARWKKAKEQVIIRDDACDLGIPGYDIFHRIFVHHMNPITLRDVQTDSDILYDPEFLICVSFETHNAIHYGRSNESPYQYLERKPGDTKLW